MHNSQAQLYCHLLNERISSCSLHQQNNTPEKEVLAIYGEDFSIHFRHCSNQQKPFLESWNLVHSLRIPIFYQLDDFFSQAIELRFGHLGIGHYRLALVQHTL